ncbi:hypothetical protein NMG60_11029325 [Bertholletia excelsa]
MASSSPSSSLTVNSSAASADPIRDLTKQVRRHEVAIAELGNLPPFRGVYQKTGNIFFRTTVQKATTYEQKQLDVVKAKLQKLSPP